MDSAFDGRIGVFRMQNRDSENSIEQFMTSVTDNVVDLWSNQIERHHAIKTSLEVYALYEKPMDGDGQKSVKSFSTHAEIVTSGSEKSTIYDDLMNIIVCDAEEFEERDSGWSFKECIYLEIFVYKYDPLRGACYFPLPQFIMKKNTVLNIHNPDESCFFWAVTAYLYPSCDSPHITAYPHFKNVLHTQGIDVPVQLKSIPLFERLNNISVNVYTCENRKIVGPLYYTKEKRLRHVNLLYLTRPNLKDGHYFLIKDLSRLVGRQLSRHHDRKWLCDGCLLYFSRRQLLLDHQCKKVKVILPDPSKNIMEFVKLQNKFPVPFVIVADTETFFQPVVPNADEQQQLLDEGRSYCVDLSVHEPMSFSYYIKCWFNEDLDKFELYRGPESMKIFVERLQRDVRAIASIYDRVVGMTPLTEDEQRRHETTTTCHVCEQPLNNEDKVADHCHQTGRYRGAAHNACNLKCRTPNYVPIILHNFSNYDAHLIVTSLGSDKDNRIKVIAKTKENYISLTKYLRYGNDDDDDDERKKTIQMRFIDSYRFLPSALGEMVQTLADEQFKITRRYYPDRVQFDLMKRKGVFPYEYITNLQRLEERRLPPRAAFYSHLKLSDISESEYLHAHNVWNTFHCRNLGDFSDIYLKTDVLLLTDVIQNFRQFSLSNYGLDPCHYVTSPSLSFDAMKKFTKIKLELMTDYDMTQFVIRNIRGGLSQCNVHHSKANNKYMEDYNPDVESSYLVELDENNLYGAALCEALPRDGFRFLSPDEVSEIDVMSIADEGPIGYIIEADICYPRSVHDHHADLPFLVESMIPPGGGKQKKLIANLYDKKK